jgi:exopolysaccharide biosynthesis polyprenyl glycosylphosphotransferase
VIADAVTAIGLFVGVSVFRFGDGWMSTWVRAGADWRVLALAYATGWVFLIWLHGLYRLRVNWSIRADILAIFRAVMLFAVLIFSALFVLKLPQVSRLFIVGLVVTQLVTSSVARTGLRWAMRTIRTRGLSGRRMLIVGAGPAAREFADRIERHRELGLQVMGHLAWSGEASVEGRRPVLGQIDEITAVIHEQVVDEVAICLTPSGSHLIEPVARVCEEEGKIVRIPLAEVGLTLPGGHVEEYGGISIQSLVYGPDRVLGLIGKRVVDVVLGTIALIVLAPLLLIVALVIRLVDGGPVLFRQSRVGLNGRLFEVVKFRSMVPDAEDRLAEVEPLNEIEGHAFKVTNDPRLSRTGRVLRATSIDELPQIWNVVLGEMSLVGPRPPLPREVAEYDVWHRRRLSMKPGITGLWQVEARRNDSFDRWVELDLAYIDRWSLWLDLKIMLRTVPAMLQGR